MDHFWGYFVQILVKNADVSKKSANFEKNTIFLETTYGGLLPCQILGL